ncbi:hypothetical protein KR222_003614, partial [Zaprionus bogoriensis]
SHSSEKFEAYNNVPMGASHYRNRLFVTVPRRHPGIPSTLNYIDMQLDGTETSPKLRAYPDFHVNQFNASKEALVSVYRTTVDVTCQRLWFIDTGLLDYPDNRQQIRRPSIWIMDLKTDQLYHRYEMPESIVDTGRGLASIAVDVTSLERCGDTFAYIPDEANSRLYVYSMAKDRMWAFSHNYFHFDPLGGNLHIGGHNFRWSHGITSIALGKPLSNGSRMIYFHALSSNDEFRVACNVLRNESNAARSDHFGDFLYLGRRGDNRQSTAHQVDQKTGVMFFAEIQTNGVGCWNMNYPFSAANHGIVVADPENMIFPSDLEIDEDGDIWVLTNTLPKFIYSKLDTNEYNFRVWKRSVTDAKHNTMCQ